VGYRNANITSTVKMLLAGADLPERPARCLNRQCDLFLAMRRA
jgi:hypothetical protein